MLRRIALQYRRIVLCVILYMAGIGTATVLGLAETGHPLPMIVLVAGLMSLAFGSVLALVIIVVLPGLRFAAEGIILITGYFFVQDMRERRSLPTGGSTAAVPSSS